MDDTANRAKPVAPWYFWAISIVSLLWNAFGCFDYTMMKLHNAWWLAAGKVPPEMIAKIDAAPLWGTAGWALGVWASLTGSLLLLLRSRHAATAFIVSFVGALVGFVWQMRAGTVPSPAIPALILSLLFAQWWYARRVLR